MAPSTAPSANHTPLCPSLPPELWILIFSFHDPLHLWTTCRQISTTLRSCAESTFAKHFLSSIHISFHLDRFNLGGRAPRPEVPVLFDRLVDCDSDDGAQKQSVAIFSDRRPCDEVVGDAAGRNPAVRYGMIQARWAEVVRGYRAEMPGYTVWMEGVEGVVACVNDSGLPGLDIDVDRREVRVAWATMLSLLFREHKVLMERLAGCRGQGKGNSKGSPSWSTNHETSLRREIRRARLKEHYAGDQRMQWAVASLKYFDPSVESGSKGTVTLFKMDPDLPGARLGERWFGSNNIVKELFLDEWSCMHRIEGKILELNEK